MKAALVQMRCTPDPVENLDKALRLCGAAADAAAELVCLPELFRSRYFCQSEDPAAFDLAEPVPGPATAALGALARERGIVVIAPLFEKRAAGLYHNTVAVIDKDGTVAGMYRKTHIPDDPGYYEKFFFAPGDLGYPCVPTAAGAIGPLICWDQWYPEAARLAALRGAEMLVYPTAIGWLEGEREAGGEDQRDAWRTVQRGHAIANGVYVLAVNRTGTEPAPDGSEGITFWGSSFVADPFGRVIAEAGEKEEILYADMDHALVEETRRTWPFLRDRRIDAYDGLTERFRDQEPE